MNVVDVEKAIDCVLEHELRDYNYFDYTYNKKTQILFVVTNKLEYQQVEVPGDSTHTALWLPYDNRTCLAKGRAIPELREGIVAVFEVSLLIEKQIIDQLREKFPGYIFSVHNPDSNTREVIEL